MNISNGKANEINKVHATSQNNIMCSHYSAVN